MNTTLRNLAAFVIVAASFGAQAARLADGATRSYCTADRALADETRSYGSGWKATQEEAEAAALARCEADVIVYPSSCEISNCTTRAAR